MANSNIPEGFLNECKYQAKDVTHVVQFLDNVKHAEKMVAKYTAEMEANRTAAQDLCTHPAIRKAMNLSNVGMVCAICGKNMD